MKKLLSFAASAIGAFTLFIGSALAGLPQSGLGSVSGLSSAADIQTGIANLINGILNFVLIVAVAFVVVAGIRLIVSGGEEGEKDKSKTTIIYVAAGIIVVLLAKLIVLFVNNLL
ncbi:hypothetical protein EXS65_04440 [Candidatus Peribacteria bacterium]|nr:hypothetical protein [Candidatus Peribacteria bacterium]